MNSALSFLSHSALTIAISLGLIIEPPQNIDLEVDIQATESAKPKGTDLAKSRIETKIESKQEDQPVQGLVNALSKIGHGHDDHPKTSPSPSPEPTSTPQPSIEPTLEPIPLQTKVKNNSKIDLDLPEVSLHSNSHSELKASNSQRGKRN